MSVMSPPAELDVFHCPLDGINLVEASAGTGKTWNLCGLYLRLLLEQSLETRQILVVTFTNAATAELRERIRARIVETLAYLEDPRLGGGDPFVPRLVETLVEGRGLAREALRRRLELARHSFDEAAIFTIHGFCQRALADAPFAAGQPMGQQLLADDAELRLEAARDFWRRRIAGDALSDALADELARQGDSPERYAGLLKRVLAKPLAQLRWPEGSEAPPPDDLAGLEQAWRSACACWSARREDVLGTLAAGRSQLNGQTYTDAALARSVEAWDALSRADEPMAPAGEKLELLAAGKLKDRTKRNCITPVHTFFDLAQDYLSRRQALEHALLLGRARLLQGLLAEAGTALAEAKRALRGVTFDDMLQNLHQRLTGGRHPGLAQALARRFPAALIDEFQDTDPLQFGIFRAIYAGAPEAARMPVFLVGDPKQAIYSFRNADLPTYLAAKRQAQRSFSLVANQRASQPLIEALNVLFGGHPSMFMLDGLDYQRVAFGAKPRKAFVDRSEPRGDLQVWTLHAADATPPAKAEAQRDALRATAAEIARLLAAAARGEVSLDGAPLAPGDIAVLVRSHAQGSAMKQALAQLGVGSVELSQAGIFQTPDAEEVERVLRAVLEPARADLARAALATELMGLDAAAVDALTRDGPGLTECMTRFDDLRGLWLQRGFGVMYRRLLADVRVAERMLARPDGERRLTNFLHLGECLHQASETRAAPDLLLRHLETRRRESDGDEALQLRLESDQNLVQIVTVHKSKGLEYPVVFCPTLWDGHAHAGGRDGEGLEYHDDRGRPVLDLRGADLDEAEKQAIGAGIKLEQAAERLRLIYVALTRAVHRCYLVAGCYDKKAFGRSSFTESARSPLNWLVLGAGHTPQGWLNARPEPAEVVRAWQRLQDQPGIRVEALPGASGAPLPGTGADPDALSVPAPPFPLPGAWRVSSFSGLSQGATHERAASDHDARVRASAQALPAQVPATDILRFPRGPEAGDCIHAAFEHLDFAEPATWNGAVERALSLHPQRLPDRDPAAREALLKAMLLGLVAQVLDTELVPGLRLASVPRSRRLTELEFNLPARRLAAHALNETLADLGYPVPRLGFQTLQGYLKGFIDLVFQHQGRFYVLDWKSNHLGGDADAYGQAGLAEAMTAHGYHLQGLLYALALQRYLRQRLPDYDHARHFGGVLYLFVRGVRPDWRDAAGRPAGVHFQRPDAAALARLDALLEQS